MTTFEELDALSTRELHDRAVKRAERRLDVQFFWRLLQEGTAADAADGDARARRGADRALEPPGARRAAPRRRRARGAPPDLHRLPAQTLGIARIRPSGGLAVPGRLTRPRGRGEIGARGVDPRDSRYRAGRAVRRRADGAELRASPAGAAACGSRPPRRSRPGLRPPVGGGAAEELQAEMGTRAFNRALAAGSGCTRPAGRAPARSLATA